MPVPKPVVRLFVVDAKIGNRWVRITPPAPFQLCQDIVQARKKLNLRGKQYEIVPASQPVTDTDY